MKSKGLGMLLYGVQQKEGIGCGRGRGKESCSPNTEKKTWSGRYLREDEIRSYSHERRKLDKMQDGGLQANPHVGLAIG